MDYNLLIIIGFVVLTILIFKYRKSGFEVLNVCTRDNREYPSGKVPGSDLVLTSSEKKNLLINFINNGDKTID